MPPTDGQHAIVAAENETQRDDDESRTSVPSPADTPAIRSSKTPINAVTSQFDERLFEFFDEKGQFQFRRFLESMADQMQKYGITRRSLGVGWRNLTVTGVGEGYREQDTFASLLMPDLRSLFSRNGKPIKTILDNLSGTVLPGEMLLVLGRPGAGCTSFLKTLACYRDGFRSIEGDITYTGLTVDDIQNEFRGDIVFAPEDDVHFPTLTVKETLAFASAMRTPQAQFRFPIGSSSSHDDGTSSSRKDVSKLVVEMLSAILGLRHTFNTRVGDSTIRGVSGGERKRVTVAETLASRASLVLFDNSSRGLDASTALEFVQALRMAAEVHGETVCASLYQASDKIVNEFDKVLVLNQGRQAYFGPMSEAVAYFEALGFQRLNRQSISDFLVACASGEPTLIKASMPGHLPPIAPEEQKMAWEASRNATEIVKQADEFFAANHPDACAAKRQQYKEHVRKEKATTARAGSSYTISIPMQIRWAVLRRLQILMNDRATQITPIMGAIFQGLILGSIFFQMPEDTANMFSRGGAIFAGMLFLALNAMAEITRCYAQRPIVIRHRKFGFLHPFADAFGDWLIDVQMQLITVMVFSIVFYFMCGLASSASQFFVFYITVSLAVLSMSAFFRMLAAVFRAESQATMLAGVGILVMCIYTGYMIPRPQMRIWYRWLSYATPVPFAFEILMANEFRHLRVRCTKMFPSGADVVNQVCPIPGAKPAQFIIDGKDYLEEQYGFKWSNSPRNFGVVIAFWLFFVVVWFFATELQQDATASGSVIVYERGSEKVKELRQKGDVEKATGSPDARTRSTSVAGQTLQEKLSTPSGDVGAIFNWRDVCYDVQVKDETRRLLRNVSGFVMPGKMTALMGESGAGKTTLLNVLAQRVSTGVITGQFKVDAQPIARSFQRDTGYCQQQDIHMETQTVREALEFSALLRQPASVSQKEKLAYAQTVIELLEMDEFADAVIGEAGEGLNLEQRKLVTVGVELAARPKLLIFLDEPTSGLDSIAASSIIRLLKKLAEHGQAILCTIHQPSGELFNQFDSLLLLQKGGKTVFFGETGENSDKLIAYFERLSGQRCGAEENPAEYILDVIGAGATASSDIDWYGAFLESTLHRDLMAKLDEIDQRVSPSTQSSARAGEETEYAMPFAFQMRTVLLRAFSHYYRSTDYLVAKIGLNLIAGLFIGSSFWGRGDEYTVASVSNSVFAAFLSVGIVVPLSQQLQPVFVQLRTLYEARERPSKMYSWPVAVLSSMLVEVPWNFFGGTLFWLPWYWMAQFPSGKTAAIVWGLLMILQLFFASFSQAVAAMAPNATIAAMLFSMLFTLILFFCGVMQPPSSMPKFWESWMYHLSPLNYMVDGILGALIGDRPIRCTEKEFFTLIPPTGQTCESFLSSSAPSASMIGTSAGVQYPGKGYYRSNDDGTCGYCQYRRGTDYLHTVGMHADTWGRDYGIMCAFVVFNYALCLAAFYFFRISTFSFSSLFTKTNKNKKT